MMGWFFFKEKKCVNDERQMRKKKLQYEFEILKIFTNNMDLKKSLKELRGTVNRASKSTFGN